MYFSVNEIILNPGGFMFKRMIGLLLYISLFVFTVGILIQNIPPKTYITVQFEEARPIRHRMSVYYKGFRIGRTIRMRPSKDYRTTLLTVALNPQDLKLPINVTARLNREKKRWREHDFIEIIYPDSPSLYYLKDGDVIKGNTVVDLDSFIAASWVGSDGRLLLLPTRPGRSTSFITGRRKHGQESSDVSIVRSL